MAAPAPACSPFAAGAAAITLVLLALPGQAPGLPAIDPVTAAGGGAILGAPAARRFARRVRRLMDEADAAA